MGASGSSPADQDADKAKLQRLQMQTTKHLMVIADVELEVARLKKANEDQLMCCAAGSVAALAVGFAAGYRMQAPVLQRAAKEAVHLQQHIQALEADLASKTARAGS